jgi:NTP pyrophosphatase (non-canonical NTP hydrolase)
MSRLIPDLPISAYLDEPDHFWDRPEASRQEPHWILDDDEKKLFEKKVTEGGKLSKIQREVGRWAWTNFGGKALGINPYLGIIEEVGELSKAVLKKSQGIRGSSEKHDSDAVDAIGDIMIYLMNYLNANRQDISEPYSKTWYDKGLVSETGLREGDCKSLVVWLAVDVAAIPSEVWPANSLDRIVPLLTHLQIISGFYGRTLLSITEETWRTVGKRNWVEDPLSGGGHTHRESESEVSSDQVVTQIPLSLEDVPPGSFINIIGGDTGWRSILLASRSGVVVLGTDDSSPAYCAYSWEDLQNLGATIKRPGEDWQLCSKAES